MNNTDYIFQKIEKRAQLFWNANNCFSTGAQKDGKKEKYYVLGMFPYPSGTLHMGHLRNYAITDIVARFKRACGFKVLHPIGWDAFGLPAENAAIQNNINPSNWTKSNIKNMQTELQSLGISYDWSNTFATCDSEYYSHEQKFFLQLLSQDIVYKKESWVNWDPIDKTVLANEQVIDGKGWRSGANIERKKMNQWHMRITNYSEQLLKGLANLDQWPKNVLRMQENWIGKKQGTKIIFNVKNSDKKLEVFTTKPETIFAASFCAISPEHEFLSEFLDLNPDEKKNIYSFAHKKDTVGVDTKILLEHPLIKEREIPLYVASFVISDYAYGAVLCCPAHDARDYTFAKKYGLPILLSVKPPDEQEKYFDYTEEDTLINSYQFSGMSVGDGRKKIVDFLINKKIASNVTQYKLRDWCISRQRYWGCPIPVIHCPKCGIVPNEDLPVSFPSDLNFSQSTSSTLKDWSKTQCPKCFSQAEKETDTLDTFFESSWYFLGFTNKEHTMFDKQANNFWMPVDLYVGGIEHAILHLLYSRLFSIILNKEGFLSNPHPFKKLLTQGMVCHKTYKDKNGDYIYPEEAKNLNDVFVGKSVKMSKSKKNVVSLKEITKTYGADTSRLFITSDSPPEKNLEWSDDGIIGCYKFMKKIWNFGMEIHRSQLETINSKSEDLESMTNQTIKEVTNSLEDLKFNTTIARLRELFNFMTTLNITTANLKDSFIIFLKMLEPFTPHIAFELIRKLTTDKVASTMEWPKYDNSTSSKNKKITMAITINGIKRSTIDIDEKDDMSIIENNALDKIKDRLLNKKVEKIILVKNKIINFVTKDEDNKS